MRGSLLVRVLMFLWLLGADPAVLVARAQEAQPAQLPAPIERVSPLDRGSWAREIRQMRAAERLELADLSRKARLAQPGADHAQAQRGIESAKRAWRRRVLEAQLTRTRAAGLADVTRKLELRLAELEAVAQRRVPAAPAGGEQ